MDAFTLFFWLIGVILFALAYFKARPAFGQSVRKSRQMMRGLLLDILGIIMLIGLMITLIPPDQISRFFNADNVMMSTVVMALIGSIILLPGFVAFPLVGSFLDLGIGVMPAMAFLTTLTMVGFVTIPVEKKEFGLEFTLYRNAISFVFAIIIAVMMGVIM